MKHTSPALLALGLLVAASLAQAQRDSTGLNPAPPPPIASPDRPAAPPRLITPSQPAAAIPQRTAAAAPRAPEPAPRRASAGDDGSIWQVTNQWNEEWEMKFSKWLEENLDPDFFVRLNLATDCADVPYLARWIFARNNGLPQGAHDKNGVKIGFWTKQFADLPRDADWKRDKRFIRALTEVNETVQVGSLPFDTYPIAVLPEAGRMRPGTVITDSKHSRIVTRIDRRSFHPIIMSSSTLPPKVRQLTVEMLNREVEFEAEFGFGIVNWSWWKPNGAGGWEPAPDESMPGFSMEQYDIQDKLDDDHISDYLQALYGYQVKDPNTALEEFLADLRSAVNMRVEVAGDAWNYYQAHPKSVNDKTTDQYDFYSTGQRDARLRGKYGDFATLIERKFFTRDALEDRLAKETYTLPSGEPSSFLELNHSVERGLITSEPWDSPRTRFGVGGYRLVWRRQVAGDVANGLWEGPMGGVVAGLSGSIAAFGHAGERLWERGPEAGRTTAPINDSCCALYFADTIGQLTAVDPSGKVLWSVPTGGTDLGTPYADGDGRIYVASGNGRVAAFAATNGQPLWNADLGRDLHGPASAPGAPLYFSNEAGKIVALSREGKGLWSLQTKEKLYAAGAVDSTGNAYFGGSDGTVYCVSPAGQFRWDRAVGGRFVFPLAAGPDGRIYGVSEADVVCLDNSGKQLWRETLGDAIYAPPAISPQGNVYAGCIDYKLYALGPDGKTRWTFPTAGSILSRPYAAGDGRIYVGGQDKMIYALEERGGS